LNIQSSFGCAAPADNKTALSAVPAMAGWRRLG
jgi:hypothetical protein